MSSAATSAASSLRFGEAIRSLSCWRLVALTIGAVIDLRCISQASATAASGTEGLQIAQETELSLVLLDLNLPGLSGFEVMERLKADERTRHLRCIALSADALPHQIQHALSLGFDDYWTKPIDVGAVIGKLKDEFRQLSEAV